jgi:hypothetical protein
MVMECTITSGLVGLKPLEIRDWLTHVNNEKNFQDSARFLA